MEKGRILFTDLDGTLLSDDNQISKKNHGAIEDTLKKGSFVAAATGRPLESAKAVAKKLGLKRNQITSPAYKPQLLRQADL